MATRNFKSCSFGPPSLRLLLRRHLAPGERVTGWGFATRTPNASLTTLNVLSGLVPVLMFVTLPIYTRETRRFLILTDQRLLMLRTDRRKPGRQRGDVIREIELCDVVVRAAKDDGAFEILGWDGVARERLKIPKQPHCRPTARLWEGLGVLAREDSGMLLEVRRSIVTPPRAGEG
ncbi:MAG: hypothetical protein EA376_07300 [Phycisphaeraceae bacterium]|nr:MAG: hypothetical protein EA376_07300 [Phycisphaeraceae bacterium]